MNLHQKLLILFSILALLQPAAFSQPTGSEKGEEQQFKILTNGKKISVQAEKTIRNIMVWSSQGNRLVESKNINENRYSFTVPSRIASVYLLIEFADGSRHTRRIGIP